MSETKKRRVKLVVAYDGTDFCGWAPQRGHRTVHGTLTETILQVSGEEVELLGASRTDSGAHARGQVCHFDSTRSIKPLKWVRALNDLLPPDLSVKSCQFVNSEFHSRFSAQDRHYRYRILTGKRDALRARFTHWYGRPLDVALMHDAAQTLVGEHDFFAFTQLVEEEENTVRKVFSLNVRQVRDEVWIDVVATAYARGMMRRISGALWEIGRGMQDPATLEVLLAQTQKGKAHWPTVLPANGLCLMKVRY
ncbi:MAG: tRNA pseudouridine(38-40) synthase TruA [Armatimonadetes bacterium]|nr:tRNA pseudouridine(38-40) synthase TruA [Armatimonadota bacterium]